MEVCVLLGVVLSGVVLCVLIVVDFVLSIPVELLSIKIKGGLRLESPPLSSSPTGTEADRFCLDCVSSGFVDGVILGV